MRRTSKPVFFIVLGLILVFTALTFFGVSTMNGDLKKTYIKSVDDIRWGIDIRGGVDVTFSPPEGYDATVDEMNAARSIIEARLVNQNIADYEIYVDTNKDRVILRFPWKEGETSFDPEKAIQELGETALLTFREGTDADGALILEGKDVQNAQVMVTSSSDGSTAAGQPVIELKLNADGTKKFADATARLIGGTISIWMDDQIISAPVVQNAIPDGQAMITGQFTPQTAKELADKINGGALPFQLVTENYSTISPSMGMGAKDAMVMAGAIAFALVCVFMITLYRLPGVVACFTLLGQVALIIASITGFFGNTSSFTMTLPGIAGIVLSIGFGVDAAVISAERIKEELRNGKTIDGAVQAGYSRAFSAILDGNMTVIIVALILLGAFGPPNSVLGGIFSKIFFMFGPSTAGNIYSFGYTLLMGALFNLVMGVGAARLMNQSVCKLKIFRKPFLYGSKKAKVFRISFVGNLKKYLLVSAAVFACIIAGLVAFRVQMDIQFSGGSMITYAYEGDLSHSAFTDALEEHLGSGISLQQSTDIATGSDTFIVSLPGNRSLSAQQQVALTESLQAEFADYDVRTAEITNVDATIGQEFLLKCLCALALTAVLMILYIAWRFRKIGGLSAGAMGVVALLHDCIVIFGVFVLFRIPINSNFIAAILTILGYSLNDTIVVYDRIRENKRIYGGQKTLQELVTLSINQSLVRSINTSVTTIMAMVVVTIVAMIYGVNSIFSFSFPLIIGLISGTYSSICLAGPLWVKWQERKKSSKTA